MKTKIRPSIFQCIVLVLVGSMTACSTIPRLNVKYHLPQKDNTLEGMAISLSLRDDRPTPSIIGEGAAGEFKNFSEYIFFSLARENGIDSKAEVLKVTELVEEAFKHRLKNAGIVLVDKKAAETELVIVLKEFYLDLISRKWTLKTSYEANLLRNGRVVARETVGAEGERFKTIGTKEADKLAGEIVTDSVNKLNLVRLFTNAGMVSQ